MATLREQLDKRLARLKNERDKSWMPLWRDLSQYIEPLAGRYWNEEVNEGRRRDGKIINPTASFAARTLAAGMHSGMTSPASPWFKLGTPDQALMEFAPVKTWLYAAENAIREVMSRSNLYNVLPKVYHEEGVFGSGAMAALPDERDVVRFYPFTIGSYMLATSNRQQVDTLYREFKMTARQMEQQFGRSGMSATAVGLLTSNPEAWVDVCHAVEPRDNRNTQMRDAANMPYRSVYWEKGQDRDDVLRESGFRDFPVMAPRWDVLGENVYGSGPGTICLGGVKALQLMERRKAELLEKGVRPPMGAPVELRGMRASILPGDITYMPASQLGAKFEPLYQVDPTWLGQLRGEIAAEEQHIETAFFSDLFLMISQMDSVRTAYEIATRKEEKMLMLGPVLERQNDDLLDPLIDQVFRIMVEQSAPRWAGLLPGAPLLPPPPQELAGLDLRVEYTSILAQAQKTLEVASIERAIGFSGTVAATMQSGEPLDLLDPDAAMREYFQAIGVPPTLIRAEDQVAAIREQRAQAEQQAAIQQQLGSAVEGAKLLSETDTGGNNALTQLMGATQ